MVIYVSREGTSSTDGEEEGMEKKTNRGMVESIEE